MHIPTACGVYTVKGYEEDRACKKVPDIDVHRIVVFTGF